MKKTTWFVLGAFALLLAVFLVIQNVQNNKEPVETPVPTAQPTLRSLDDQDITQIEYTDSLGENIQFVQESSLVWTSPSHPNATITAGNIEELIANISELRIISTLSTTTSSEDLGLDNPNAVIIFTFNDGTTYKLEVGNPTPMGDGYYVRVDGDQIFVLPFDSIEQVATSFLTLTQTPTPELEITETVTPTDENGD